MIYLLKNGNKLVKSSDSLGTSFLNEERELTFLNIDDDRKSGYFSHNDNEISIELGGNIIFFKLDELNIDGRQFNSINELINYIYDV